MPSRRQHSKTRHGCTQCKAKRVKCDEEEPSCGRCTRAHTHCSLLDSRPLRSIGLSIASASSATSNPYASTGSSSAAKLPLQSHPFYRGDVGESSQSLPVVQISGTPMPLTEPSPNIASSQSTQSYPADLPGSYDRLAVDNSVPVLALIGSQLKPLDRELLQHYTTTGFYFLSNVPAKQQVWQDAVPREALKYDFLMHAVLAISAVQVMHHSPTRAEIFGREARSHQNLALTLSIPLLNEITPVNCHALLVLSTLIAKLTFLLPDTSGPGQSSALGHTVDFFVLLRGAKTVLKSASGWVDKGPFAPLFRFKWQPLQVDLTYDVQIAFDHLTRQNEQTSPDKDHRQMYDLAIEDLKIAFRTHRILQDEPALVFMWGKVLQEPYLAALKRYEPMALAILAYYAVLLHSLDDQWWLKDRGSELIGEISQTLPAEWSPAVQWPLYVINGIQSSAAHARGTDTVWRYLFNSSRDVPSVAPDIPQREDWFDFRFSEHQRLLASRSQTATCDDQDPDQVWSAWTRS